MDRDTLAQASTLAHQISILEDELEQWAMWEKRIQDLIDKDNDLTYVNFDARELPSLNNIPPQIFNKFLNKTVEALSHRLDLVQKEFDEL